MNPYHSERRNTNCAMWQMIFHLPDKGNPLNQENKQKIGSDQGLKGGLSDVDYYLKEKELRLEGLYTYLLIDVKAPESTLKIKENTHDFSGRTHG